MRTSEKTRGEELRLRLTVPYVGTEILAVVGGKSSRGVAYDPCSTRDPVPWSRDCPECRAGRVAAPLKVRRAVQAMCTARMVSPSSYGLQVVVGKNTRYYLVTLCAKDGSQATRVIKKRNQDPRSPVLRRMVAMLTSARESPETPRNWHSEALERLSTPHPHVEQRAPRQVRQRLPVVRPSEAKSYLL